MKLATSFGNVLTVATLVRENPIFRDMWKESTLKCKFLVICVVLFFHLGLV